MGLLTNTQIFSHMRTVTLLVALLPLAATWGIRGPYCGLDRCLKSHPVSALRSRPRMAEELAAPPATVPAAPSAYIEFITGVPEPVVPDVKLTRSRDGSTGVATFTFDNPSFLAAASAELGETTGMYLNDSEGQLRTSEVTATFVNGKPRIVKGVIVMRGPEEWDRFMRFMERYAEDNGLGFSKA